MNHHAKGAFDVTLTPQAPGDKAEGATVGRMSIVKQFHRVAARHWGSPGVGGASTGN